MENTRKSKGNPYASLKVTFEEEKEVWLCQCKKSKNPPFCDGSHNQHLVIGMQLKNRLLYALLYAVFVVAAVGLVWAQ